MSENQNMQDVRQKNYIMQLLQEQYQMLESQLSMLQSNLKGMNVSLKTLQGLNENPEKKEQEVIIPLGPNAYTKAKIINPNEVLLYIKNDIVVQKDLGEGIESLKKMIENNEEVQEKLKGRIREISQQAAQIGQQTMPNRGASAGLDGE